DDADVCDSDPGYDIDVTVEADLAALTALWLGDLGWPEAIRSQTVTLHGAPSLRRAFPAWLKLSMFAAVPRVSAALLAASPGRLGGARRAPACLGGSRRGCGGGRPGRVGASPTGRSRPAASRPRPGPCGRRGRAGRERARRSGRWCAAVRSRRTGARWCAR